MKNLLGARSRKSAVALASLLIGALGAFGTARAEAVGSLLERNVRPQARIAHDVAQRRMTPHAAGILEAEAAKVYGLESTALEGPIDRAARGGIAKAEEELARAVRRDERPLAHRPSMPAKTAAAHARALDTAAAAAAHRAAAPKTAARAPMHPVRPLSAAALDRMHTRVAALRDAEQQRWIAGDWRSGRLDAAQIAALEASQADIARLQARLGQRGYETVDEALRVQHRQDVQDWAIRAPRAKA